MESEFKNDTYSLRSDFEAPIELVFDAWSKSEHLQEWMRPPGWEVNYKIDDIKTGGSSLHSMTSPEGYVMWELKKYEEVKHPERIVCVHSMSDENGKVLGNARLAERTVDHDHFRSRRPPHNGYF